MELASIAVQIETSGTIVFAIVPKSEGGLGKSRF